jgi:TP901 family phage tail tape measure protein
MADSKRIEIALILTAMDKMSAVVSSASMKAQKKLKEVSDASIKYGRESIATGLAAAAPLLAATKAFADQEDAMLQMKAELLGDGNTLNQKVFSDLTAYANGAALKYGESAAEYMKMIRVLRENSIEPKDILGGIGDAVEKLSVLFHVPPDSIARMKQDMGILPKEMIGMTDLIARLKNAGVGKDGAEAVQEMGEAFSKAGLGAHNLGVSGLQSAKDLGALMGIFIRRGISGATVGNNFRRIFDGLRSAEKLDKANKIAKEYGMTLDFYDKNHKFKGIAGFTAEIGKLKGLNTQAISKILNPFAGKQGLSTDFLEFLSKEGISSFNEFQTKLSSQATLDAKVATMMGGLTRQFNRVKAGVINAAAAIGETYAPELKGIINYLASGTHTLVNFIKGHRDLVNSIAKGLAYFAAFKLATGGIALVVGVLAKTISSVVSVLSGLANALIYIGQAVGIVSKFMIANPIVAIIVAIAVAAFLIYKYWAPIKAFFTKIWGSVKAVFFSTWEVIKNLFLNYTPQGLIFKNWDKIIGYFGNLWGKVKEVFLKAASFFIDVHILFFNAGKNIVTSIWKGIKAMASKPVEAIRDIVKKVRDYLPFSPAKVGPLRDIHRIRLIETIAGSLKAGPMLQAMNGVMGKVNAYTGQGRSPLRSSVSSGGMQMTFAPVIHLSGGAVQSDAKTISSEMKRQFEIMMKGYFNQKERTKF